MNESKSNFIVGTILGILVYTFVCVSKCPSQWNQVCMGKHKIHVHHWLLHVIALILLIFIPVIRDLAFLRGVLVGGIIHGLMYSDWYVFFKKC
jgi:hypothetical protein